jgi:hypothetical protein
LTSMSLKLPNDFWSNRTINQDRLLPCRLRTRQT